MKKILTLICAVALVAGANAQVKQAREVGAPLSKAATMEMASPMLMSPAKGAVKASIEDTLTVEAVNHTAQERAGLGFLASVNDFSEVGSTPAVFWIPGTGWLNHYYGSGEIGYTWDFSYDGWFSIMGLDFTGANIVGAVAFIGRARSSVAKMNSKDMPFRFKLYSYPRGQVVRQMAYNDLTSNQAEDEKPIEVYYPTSPENFHSYSTVINVPVMAAAPNEKVDMGADMFGARFENPGVAGDFPSISFVFPHEHNDEDTLWNATLFTLTDGDDYAHSERAGSMYVVYDFQYQNMWSSSSTGQVLRERTSGFVLDTVAQPDKRYGILPLQSWFWTDKNGNRTLNGRQDWEPYFRIILSDNVTVERGSYYDKYVEVKINPAIDHTVIQATDKIKNVEIYNLNGKLVKTQACNSHFETISLSGLTSGMYIAKVTTVAGVANKKIMVR